MYEFMSFREFCLLQEPRRAKRFARSSFYEMENPSHYVEWYDKSKAAWEKYGDDGPPIGSTVRVLRSGFGTLGPGRILRLVEEVIRPNKFVDFVLCPFQKSSNTNPERYISYKERWWFDFEVIEDEDEFLTQ